jgi:predicted Zn-dependent protease with MMP-like domain
MMEKVQVAFQDGQIRNMKVIGQLGLEVANKIGMFSGSQLGIRIHNDVWRDPKQVSKRINNTNLVQNAEENYTLASDH